MKRSNIFSPKHLNRIILSQNVQEQLQSCSSFYVEIGIALLSENLAKFEKKIDNILSHEVQSREI